MQNSVAVQTGIRAGSITRRLPALVTFMMGLMVIYVIGFSHITVVHNGAHDTRHSNGFPCH